jgi:hypothetical protein
MGHLLHLLQKETRSSPRVVKRNPQNRKLQRSKSPASVPILFMLIAHGHGLRLYMDYRGINKISIPNRYPITNMSELHDYVDGSKIFTIIVLTNGYHIIHIKEGEKLKTVF